MKDLIDVPLLDLVGELRRRSVVSLVALKLREPLPGGADIRVLMQAEPKHELLLLGLADLALDDVRAGVREQIMGPPNALPGGS